MTLFLAEGAGVEAMHMADIPQLAQVGSTFYTHFFIVAMVGCINTKHMCLVWQ